MDDLKYIKKHYGEKMMHLCRNLFPTILEEPGKLSKLMEITFHHSRNLYEDIKENNIEEEFKNLIYRKYNLSDEILENSTKTPEVLLKEVGYELYECKTEEDIQKFKKYYNPLETLCTFKGGRLRTCYVFFAVRKDAEELKRENFEEPRREDDYGISVISIQFTRDNYTLSIKNRYNHTVSNPDATYGNNLENIIPGLTTSFEEKLEHRINQNKNGDFELPDYVEVQGKYYRYNDEINNIYYCEDNIIIENGVVKQLPQEQFILMDYFILDLRNKRIVVYDDKIEDGLTRKYRIIDRIEIKKEEDKKTIAITTPDTQSIITLNNKNQIIEYKNNDIRVLDNGYMSNCNNLEYLELQNAEFIGEKCFTNNSIQELNLPKVKELGFSSFCNCKELRDIYAPNLIKLGGQNFYNARLLEKLELPNVKTIKMVCFRNARNIKEIDLPNVEVIGNSSFETCKSLEKLNLPKVETIEYNCFSNVGNLRILHLENLKEIETQCFREGPKLKQASFPKLKTLKSYCLSDVPDLKILYVPEIEVIGSQCLYNNKELKELFAPYLKKIGMYCFTRNEEFEAIYAPELTEIGTGSFKMCTNLDSIKMPPTAFFDPHDSRRSKRI